MNVFIVFLLTILTIANIIDMVISLKYIYAESNIILYKAPILLPIVKVIVTIAFWYLFSKWQLIKSPYTQFAFCMLLIVTTYMMVMVVISNLKVVSSPELLEYAKQAPESVRNTSYLNLIWSVYLYPMIVGIVAFIVWKAMR